MAQKRAHVFIPEKLLAEIDKLVGKGKRSSLGRLTLNILLPFAQFERRVAGQRLGCFAEAIFRATRS